MWLIGGTMIFGSTFIVLGLLYLAFVNRRTVGRGLLALVGAIVSIVCITIAVQNKQYWVPVVLNFLSIAASVLGTVLGVIVALIVIIGIIVAVKAYRTASRELSEEEAAEKKRIADAIKAGATYPHIFADDEPDATDTTIYGGR